MALPIIPLALSGASFLGGLFGNRGSRTTQTTPKEPEDFSPLRNQLLQNAMRRLRTSGLPSGFETSGLQSINESFDPIQQAVQADLLSRGLNTSPVGAAATRSVNLARGGEAARFRASLPLLAQNRQNEDFERVLQLFGMRIPGQTSTTELESGSRLGTGVEGLAEMLGYLFESGAFQGGRNGGSR